MTDTTATATSPDQVTALRAELAELREERNAAAAGRRLAEARLTTLVTAAEAYVFGAAGEPLDGRRLAEARVALGEAITETWLHLRPEGPPPHGYAGAEGLLHSLADGGPPPPVVTVKDPEPEPEGETGRPADWWKSVEVSPPIARLIAKIGATHQAVTYDALDRNTDEIEAAIRQAGLIPVPSDKIQPRSIRGCAIPAGVTPPALEPGPAVDAALGALVDAARPILASLHAGGRAAGRAGSVAGG